MLLLKKKNSLITLPEGWCQIKNIWNKMKSTDFETRKI